MLYVMHVSILCHTVTYMSTLWISHNLCIIIIVHVYMTHVHLGIESVLRLTCF